MVDANVTLGNLQSRKAFTANAIEGSDQVLHFLQSAPEYVIKVDSKQAPFDRAKSFVAFDHLYLTNRWIQFLQIRLVRISSAEQWIYSRDRYQLFYFLIVDCSNNFFALIERADNDGTDVFELAQVELYVEFIFNHDLFGNRR